MQCLPVVAAESRYTHLDVSPFSHVRILQRACERSAYNQTQLRVCRPFPPTHGDSTFGRLPRCELGFALPHCPAFFLLACHANGCLEFSASLRLPVCLFRELLLRASLCALIVQLR